MEPRLPRIAEEKMTSVTIKSLVEWTEDDLEEEITLVEEMKFRPYHFTIYLEKLCKAKEEIQKIRDRIFDTFNNPNT